MDKVKNKEISNTSPSSNTLKKKCENMLKGTAF
jgi:hypothetical protein